MNRIKDNVFFKLALCVLVVFCVVTIVTLQLRYNNLKQQRDVLLSEIEAANERIDAVEAALTTPFDHEYVIKIAREKLNLRLPEEIVFYNDLVD